jgi:hypothetical protein
MKDAWPYAGIKALAAHVEGFGVHAVFPQDGRSNAFGVATAIGGKQVHGEKQLDPNGIRGNVQRPVLAVGPPREQPHRAGRACVREGGGGRQGRASVREQASVTTTTSVASGSSTRREMLLL